MATMIAGGICLCECTDTSGPEKEMPSVSETPTPGPRYDAGAYEYQGDLPTGCAVRDKIISDWHALGGNQAIIISLLAAFLVEQRAGRG